MTEQSEYLTMQIFYRELNEPAPKWMYERLGRLVVEEYKSTLLNDSVVHEEVV